jgi:hypothetical protein
MQPAPSLSLDHRFLDHNPWGLSVDSGLCPYRDPQAPKWKQPEVEAQLQGHALLHYKDGWTCISFWDRSGDTRPGSNSAFIANKGGMPPEPIPFDEMLKLSYKHFPKIFQRFGFPIIDVTPKG